LRGRNTGIGQEKPVMNRLSVVVVLLIVVFLAGFLPQYVNAKRLENKLRAARQENSLAELRDLVGLAYLQASQRDYGLAAGTSTRFFDRTREVANQTPNSSRSKSLDDLLNVRDKITTQLAKGDPGVLNELQTLFLRTRQATAVPAAVGQAE
jgi:hypothetical protein